MSAMNHRRTRLTPIPAAYQWIMLPYRALAVLGDAFVRWVRDNLRDPAK